jgi:urease beta subunit
MSVVPPHDPGDHPMLAHRPSLLRPWHALRIGVAAAGALALAACQGGVKFEPEKGLEDYEIARINDGRPVRVAVVISEDRPEAFGDDDTLADRFFDELCHERSAWDPRRRSIVAVVRFDPGRPRKDRIVDLEGDTDRIREGVDREEAERFRYAAIFWWYEPTGERGVSESPAGTSLAKGCSVAFGTKTADVEWGGPGSGGGGFEDLIGQIGDSLSGLGG